MINSKLRKYLRNFHNLLYNGCNSVIQIDPRHGASTSARTTEKHERVHSLTLIEHRMDLRMIADELNMRKDTVATILHEKI